MALTPKQVKDVCAYGQGHLQCRYLEDDARDDQGRPVCICEKLNGEARKTIDEEIDEYIRDCKKAGNNPTKDGFALGDNCRGYLKLLAKPQGYDLGN